MNATLECLPCLLRQVVEAARLGSADAIAQAEAVQAALRLAASLPLSSSPPAMAQRLHRCVRDCLGNTDPYLAVKQRSNHMARELYPALQAMVSAAADPFGLAVRLAIAGNIIDFGVKGTVDDAEVHRAISQAQRTCLRGDLEAFRESVWQAQRILYLADNAGEIYFDRVLLEQLPSGRVTVAVRGDVVLNDATLADAAEAGLADRATVIDNGSDAPGTILADCSAAFRAVFTSADLIIAKGQGNYESLCEDTAPIVFLFKVKCPVIARRVGLPVGSQVLLTAAQARQLSVISDQ